MFGTITLSYSPSEENPRDANLSMSFSSEATIPEILKHFENFLRAMEYPLDSGDSLSISEKDFPKPLNDTITTGSFSLDPAGVKFYPTNLSCMVS